MSMPKRYTLNEAYSEILKIKNQMGLSEYHEKQLKRAFEKGYSQSDRRYAKGFY